MILNRCVIDLGLFERLQYCPQTITNGGLPQLQYLPRVNQVWGSKAIQLN
jgi:hypothetical protein